MESVEERYERLMGEMTLDEFKKHLKASSLPYFQKVYHPWAQPSYIVVTPMSTAHKERYFYRDHTQFTPKK